MKDVILNTETTYKVISGSEKSLEEATEILTKAVNDEREKGWISIGDVVVVGQTRDGYYSLVQIMTNNPEKTPAADA